jgi:hypothetical protein
VFYEILVNGVRLGVYGHPHVQNTHLSVMVTDDGPEIFASGVCAEDGDLYMYNWLQQLVSGDDVVTIRQNADTNASPPQTKYKMKPHPEGERP